MNTEQVYEITLAPQAFCSPTHGSRGGFFSLRRLFLYHTQDLEAATSLLRENILTEGHVGNCGPSLYHHC